VAPVPVEVGGGLREVSAVDAVLEAGARWAVVGTRAALVKSGS
jgi:phosphoribosylformimino-5-aminoimidazole carboxamide ribonucleotide (ProFAR) isomerase